MPTTSGESGSSDGRRDLWGRGESVYSIGKNYGVGVLLGQRAQTTAEPLGDGITKIVAVQGAGPRLRIYVLKT